MREAKLTQAIKLLNEMRRVVIAFSGGVDSTFLLKIAIDTLGRENVLAVTADSETYPFEELQEAKRLAKFLGAKHVVIETSELNIPGYSENTSNRCYFCKKNLFENIIPIMEEHGYKNAAYGLIADDLGEHRPGTRAARELSIRSPLQEAGLYKDEIRTISQEMGLPTWDKPSFACLSSRIAYGEQVTIEKLRRIEKSEKTIRQLGIRQVRVRTHGNIARIETDPEDMAILIENHKEVSQVLQEFGYSFVTMDLTGYRSGSMNKLLENVRAK